MNQEIKAQWVAALRSGEYGQGYGKLCLIDYNGSKSYCCLGVLTDLAVKAGVLPEGRVVTEDPDDDRFLAFGSNRDSYYTPVEVCDWAGVTTQPLAGDHNLPTYNDGNYDKDIEPHTFSQIADLIEEHL